MKDEGQQENQMPDPAGEPCDESYNDPFGAEDKGQQPKAPEAHVEGGDAIRVEIDDQHPLPVVLLLKVEQQQMPNGQTAVRPVALAISQIPVATLGINLEMALQGGLPPTPPHPMFEAVWPQVLAAVKEIKDTTSPIIVPGPNAVGPTRATPPIDQLQGRMGGNFKFPEGG